MDKERIMYAQSKGRLASKNEEVVVEEKIHESSNCQDQIIPASLASMAMDVTLDRVNSQSDNLL